MPLRMIISVVSFVLITLFSSFIAYTQPTDTTFQEVVQEGSSVRLYFDFIKQGRAAVVGVQSVSQEKPQGTFLERPLDFFQLPDNPEWFTLLVTPTTQSPRSYPLEITLNDTSFSIPISIVNGGFIQQSVIVVSDAGGLFDRTIEDDELSRITQTTTTITPTVFWQGRGFGHPIDATLTSPFGAQRTFNGLYETLHTGWDYNAPVGKPLVATAPGQVAFAGHEAIRGNYVLIDHGYGIYSGYAHLSVVYVTQGQLVDGGQIVGLVGSTGRSSSAHAHFEMLINGLWIDSTDFIAMPLPR